MSICIAGRRRAPLPVPALIESSARGADCRLRQFGRSLIRIVNVLAYKTIPSGTRICLGIRMHCNLIPKSRPSATSAPSCSSKSCQHARHLQESQSGASNLASSQLLALQTKQLRKREANPLACAQASAELWDSSLTLLPLLATRDRPHAANWILGTHSLADRPPKRAAFPLIFTPTNAIADRHGMVGGVSCNGQLFLEVLAKKGSIIFSTSLL
jgi:hypothetical protein